jgi:alanyl-tRNA synthetase
MKTDILREKFLEFFKSKKHKVVASDSLVPQGDPTVLFTPAGMNQFKKQFLGYVGDFRRAVSSQRCLRTDDLEKVGKTQYHHTFFEMLGNFSFGDYFKKEAIAWAWEFLTEELKIHPEKLWVSVYKDDDQTYKIWKEVIKVSDRKIVRLGDKENFWPAEAKEKGPNGPCGPCSEIFFDRGSNVGCKLKACSPACSCGRFVEVWNLVFTQFNRKDGGKLEPLPHKNIDTGMGLERLAAVMQAVMSNFETDLFVPIIEEIGANVKDKAAVKDKEAVYAIVDHLRAIAFSVYDGVLPSNESRGYVIRKLIRKSVLHLRSLGIDEPFLYKLVPVLAQVMKNPYPQLQLRRENIAQIILAEEKNFFTTLNSSQNLFEEKFKCAQKLSAQECGLIAFLLYDTYGIPWELTKGWTDKNNIKISKESFDSSLSEQKSRSKSQSNMKGDVFDVKDLHLGIKETKFLGHKEFEVKAKVLGIVAGERRIKKISRGQEARIILDKTVFYAQSGGQIGDRGKLVKGKNIFEVLDTQTSQKVIVHIGVVSQGSFKAGDLVDARLDIARRLSIARNHTATHLLQAALRKVLGAHVQQQGSFVGDDRLRFDFTHFKNIEREQLDRTEEMVNNYILDNYPLKKKLMSLALAKKSGALAFFGEKYADKVTVVTVPGVSYELCGGTHLDFTGQIGLFKILHEGSVASGIRRIEAQTGSFAYNLIKDQSTDLENICSILGVPQDRVSDELGKKLLRSKELEKELSDKNLESIKNSVDAHIKSLVNINGINVIARVIDNADMNSLRKAVDMIKEKISNAVITLGCGSDLKASLVVGLTKDLADKGIDASNLIKDMASEIGGSGGGRKDFAQAGGNKPGNLNKAFDKLKETLSKIT